jgi:hypothetical protein
VRLHRQRWRKGWPPCGNRFKRVSATYGLTQSWTHPIARTAPLGLFLVTLFIALDNVGLIFLARQSLGTGDSTFSNLLIW